MKKFLSLCVLSFVGFSTVAVGDDLGFNVGADAQWRFMPLQKGSGDNIVKKSYPQGAVYGGMKFNDFFGLEVGYQRSVSAKRQETLNVNYVSYFSDSLEIDPGDHYVSRSKVSTQGFYTGVLGFLPISEEYRLKLIASVGVVRMKTKISSALDLVEPTGTTSNSLVRTFIQTKWIPKVGAGIQHMIDDNIGVRAMAGWEQTARFKRIRGIRPDGTLSNYAASLKNSATLGLGMFYNF